MAPVYTPPRPPAAPDPLDAADEALARVRATLRDASEDELDTGRHEIHVTVNTAPSAAPQPSAHDLDEYVKPSITLPQIIGAIATVVGAIGAVLKALNWF